MPEDDHLSEAEIRKLLEYPRTIRGFITLDELRTLLQGYGSPQKLMARNAEIDEILSERKTWRTVRKAVKEFSVWVVAVATLVTVVYSGYNFITKQIRSSIQQEQE